MNRRDFIKTTAVVSAALAGAPSNVGAVTEKPSIRKYREIGKTGLKMSDISMGTVRLNSPSLLLRAIDRGINYVDTSPDYGKAEKHIGNAMNKIRRDKLILASKFCRTRLGGGHLSHGSSKKEYIAVIDDSLARLKTDYIDICFIHSIGSRSKDLDKEKRRMLDDEMLAAAEDLKKAGKIRFLGASSHGPNNLEDRMTIAVRSGHFDVIMPAFNFMKFSDIPDVLKDAKEAITARQKKKRAWLKSIDLLKEAEERGVGVVAMKTLAGERDLNFSSKGEPFQPAAFKWVLSQPGISGLVVTIKTVDQLDLYLSTSGQSLTAADREILKTYARRYDRQYCRTGCNQCEAECPRDVEIATALRYQMYFTNYGMEKRAMEQYADLKGNAKNCLDCEEEFCEGACPYGLPIKSLLNETHDTLTLKV
jgi:predicted aldo/keto reductase-like oxidoreductase